MYADNRCRRTCMPITGAVGYACRKGSYICDDDILGYKKNTISALN